MANFSPKTYLFTVLSNFAIQAFTIVQGILIARMLGVEGRGEYTTVLLWPTLLATLGLLGSNVTFGRLGAKKNSHGALFLGAIKYSIASATITMLVGFFLIPLLLPEKMHAQYLWLTRFLLWYILFNHVILNCISIYQGQGNFKRMNLLLCSFYPIYITMLLVGFFLKIADIRYCVLTYLAGNFAVMLLVLWQCLPSHHFKQKTISIPLIFKSSLPFGMTIWVQNGLAQLDKILILYCLGIEQLGLYVVALSAGSAASSLGNAASQIIFSKSAGEKTGNGFDYISKVFRCLIIVYLGQILVLSLLMPFLLPLLYGKAFVGAVSCANILLFGAALSGLNNTLDQSIRAQGNAYLGLSGKLIGFATLAGTGTILGKYFGINGMAISYMIAQTATLFYLMKGCQRFFGASDRRIFLPYASDVRFIYDQISTLVRRWYG